MRHLNKIIFINSSSIKYAEVELDGNVHFIGTQGVGKSTLLRTILFFYNANKSKLGIGKEKQRFDDYYFPYPNAYIIYEVQHENRCYCVLSYKVNNKVAFRFIDAAYQRGFFVNTNGWDDIRECLGKQVHYSRLITRYEEFRQIIYGDKGVEAAFRKYAIVEGKQYQNMVRTIQNVFLNANLEAKFIKDTIIQSISDKPLRIDIDNYGKHHLKDFENQIKDIKIWFNKDKHGKSSVKKQADSVIDGYRRLNFLQREQQDAVVQILRRMQLIEQEKPRLLMACNEADEKFTRIQRNQQSQSEKYQRRARKMFSDINLLKKQISDAKEKQQNYKKQDIDTILQRVAQAPRLQAEHDSLDQEKQLLEAQFSEIKEKFTALINQENNQLTTFINQQQDEKNRHKSEFIDEKVQLDQKTQQLIRQIKSDYRDELDNLAVAITHVREKENEQKQLRAELKYQQFFSDDIQQCRHALSVAKSTIETAKNAIQTHSDSRKNLRREAELAIDNSQRQYHAEVAELRKHSDQLQQTISQEQAKLQHSEASFYRWLNRHKPDWRDNIGRVIDESIAFEETLNPTLSDAPQNTDNNVGTPTLFGINVTLHHLESRIKTDEERRQMILELNEQKQQSQQHLATLDREYKTTLDKLNKRFNQRVAEQSDAIAENEYRLSTAKQKEKQQLVSLGEWQEKAKQEKQHRQTVIEQALEALANEKLTLEEVQTRQQKKRQRDINLVHNNAEKSLSALQVQFDAHCQTIEQQINRKKQHNQQRIKEIQTQKYQALNQGGLDSERLQVIETTLSELQQQLAFITDKQALVIEYKKDKRELFDHVATWKKQQQGLESKQQQLDKVQAEEQQKLTEQLQKQKQEVERLGKQRDLFEADIQAFETFQKSEVFIELENTFQQVHRNDMQPNDTMSESSPKPWAEPLSDTSETTTAVTLITELRDKLYQYRRVFDEMKKAVNRFVDYFSEGNVFHFPKWFADDNAVMLFAVELKEFIDENKIIEYEKRVNARLAHIVREIAKDTDELVAKEAEIEKIIKKINQDFISKNFVEAIKEMEMRKQESSHPIFQLLKQIKAFRDENDAVLGERDLFTTDSTEQKNQIAVTLLSQLIKTWENSKRSEVTLADSFDLAFRIVENDNDSGWVEKLSHVGSEGTDVLVKAMVNILLLNVFKETASKKFKDFKLHCMMDEIGRLHPNNVKGILRFANERNIMLINGSPTSQNAMDYRYTYKLSKNKSASGKHVTAVTRLVKVD